MAFKLSDFISDKQLADIATNVVKEQVADIRAGKVITRSYSPFTVIKRRKHGLNTSFVDLTGNSTYSGHPWRTLDSWHIIIQGKKAVLVWNNSEAERIYKEHLRRYGQIFK